MCSKLLFFFLGITTKESLGSIAINLLSDYLSVKISDRKLRYVVRKFRKKLYIWVDQFQKKNDGTILTSGTYINYLENYRVIDKIYEYVFSEVEEQIEEDEFLNDLKARSVAHVREQNKMVNLVDEEILKEFYKKLLEKIKVFTRSIKELE